MQEINLNSWEEFEERVQELTNENVKKRHLSKLLYRGQGDSTWGLNTTLERHGKMKLTLEEYHRLISVVKPQIESFTRNNWNILSYPDDFNIWIEENNSYIPHAFSSSPEFQDTLRYMVYLRHYGFPSPLLDWTLSPYIAAYFAFRNAIFRKKDVSIYAFLESRSEIGLKSGSSKEPYIFRFGPYIKTDRRHFVQQSQYTICLMHDTSWRYEPHDSAFANRDTNQNLLWKFNISYTEALKVLRLLEYYNINALSLFGSQESLMETMTLWEIHLK